MKATDIRWTKISRTFCRRSLC